jgi:hypothetical protein
MPTASLSNDSCHTYTFRLFVKKKEKTEPVHFPALRISQPLYSWLATQEDKYDFVLYQADLELTGWTRRCIRQADSVLVVGLGTEDPKIGPAERVVRQAVDIIIVLPSPSS